VTNLNRVCRQFLPHEPDSVVNYRPAVTLTISQVSGEVTVTWPFGFLEPLDFPSGHWTTLMGVASPHSASATALQKFYRVRVN